MIARLIGGAERASGLRNLRKAAVFWWLCRSGDLEARPLQSGGLTEPLIDYLDEQEGKPSDCIARR